MRIADSYFRRLLFDTPALDAVIALSQLWERRARETVAGFGLSAPEYAVTLCLIYTGEVGNGGHGQFFGNRGGRLVPDTLEALAAVGLARQRGILARACTVFPGGSVPHDRHEVGVALDALGDEPRALLSELDRELWREPVDGALLAYLRKHAEQLLLPERG